MKLPQAILFLLAFVTTIHALALPASLEPISEAAKELFKRKGGGGGGGRGGGGSSSSSSSGGSRSGSGSSSSGSSSSSSRTGTSSTEGGATSRGSGPAPAFGAGGTRYYGGGASVPYKSGATRSSFGAAPYLIGGGAVLGIGTLGLYGAYVYAYPHYWNYYNRTSNRNESHPANCYCARYTVCGCDDNNSTDYQNAVANNASVAQLANNGTLYVNGSLPNGTTAAGGSDSGAAGLSFKQSMGYWPLVAGVSYAVWFM
ncbi:hypothetical protein HII31_00841 [Pseudocercospora fuligena]|uniref:DUF7732 domain-containing protein n=1 Tax=Pseudocercospora fuligena TaxID=685502 RepID=A0A8H6RVN9_9PEZI|nr:hypothetical protein HII31_00841 [Pseudocercospora fuligena]